MSRRRAFDDTPENEDDSGIGNIKDNSKKSKTPVLDHFGRDLTKLAKDGALDPVIGRELEIDKVVQILNKRKKNNPILVGEAGVGKTAIVEGIANRIAKKEVERWLFNKRIVEINFTSIISGTKYRGQFEERMAAIIKEIEENPNVIVFIDEIHNIIGAGGAAGSMDAANIIKTPLSRGTMKVIGATTVDEYKKIIESDSALERRFQKVNLSIPTKEETVEIIKQIKNRYEDHHSVSYDEEVIQFCVELADRYINYRNFPDKAIDVIDEVGSKVKLRNSTVPKEVKDMELILDDIIKKKKEASDSQDYEDAAKFRDAEHNMQKSINEKIKEWEESCKKNKIPITIEDVASIIASHTGIPLQRLTDNENDRLISMDSFIKSKVIGQDIAVEKVVDAIQRSRIGIQDPNKPIASFLFLGSTGIGKTHLAKSLSKYMFNTDESFVRIDMSEFMDKVSVNKLIGSPPGYVGYEDKGMLTEKIKNRPYSIILFDEIEKAHPDVFNILLQILDEGKLTDNTGKEVNFKNTIIIMTSNIGTSKILNEKVLGFKTNTNEYEDISEVVLSELKKFFKPELINRIDEKIVFKPLNKEDILKIVELELSIVIERIKERGLSIVIDKSAKNYLVETGYDKEYGARPLKRAITKNIENLIAKSILRKEAKEGVSLKITYSKKEDKIVIKNGSSKI